MHIRMTGLIGTASYLLKDWKLRLPIIFVMVMTRHLAFGAPLADAVVTNEASVASVFRPTISEAQFGSGSVEVDYTATTHEETSTQEMSSVTAESVLPHSMDNESRVEDLTTHMPLLNDTEELSEHDGSNGDTDAEFDEDEGGFSYDSPRSGDQSGSQGRQNAKVKRCISARLVEAIEGDAELQNMAKNNSLCKWNYENDVNTRRVPELLLKAVCQSTPSSLSDKYVCESVLYYITVRKLNDNDQWVDDQESITVGCVLTNRLQDSQQAPSNTESNEDYQINIISETSTRADSQLAPDSNEDDY